jgi:hypothetical protein
MECESGHGTFGSEASCTVERDGKPVIPDGVQVEFHGFPVNFEVSGQIEFVVIDAFGNERSRDTAIIKPWVPLSLRDQ